MKTAALTGNNAHTRRVLLLNTDERAGLVAALAVSCAERGVSLEITTGPGHVVLTFQADDSQVAELEIALPKIDGVIELKTYKVIADD